LTCDTFWGVAADGVSVFFFGSTVSGTTDVSSFAGTNGLTPTDLFNIWNCIDTTWGQLTNYQAAANLGDPVPPADAPIVPWAMNAHMGMYDDFNAYVSTQTGSFTADDHAAEYSASNPGGSATSPTPPVGDCARQLTSTTEPDPAENNITSLLDDVQNNQGGLNQNALSTNNPANWIWFGSNGMLSAYPALSDPTLFGNSYVTGPQVLNGVAPSPATIGAGTYPAEVILSVVTPTTEATCPLNSDETACDFAGGPVNANGTTDLNVPGASSGAGGAVREFVRFLCRDKAESEFTANGTIQFSPTDPYTNVADYTEIGNVISDNGFTLVPTSVRSIASNCDVQTNFPG
jgi:hypothetical protein